MDKVVEDFSLEIIIDDFTKQLSTTIDDIILRNPLYHYEFSEILKQIESQRKPLQKQRVYLIPATMAYL